MSFDVETALKYYVTRSSKGYEFKHNKATRLPIVPFITKLEAKDIEKLDFRSFDGYIGHCYRQMIQKELPTDLEDTNFKPGLKAAILKFIRNEVNTSDDLREKFLHITESLFFNGPELIKFSVDAQAYLYWKRKDSGLENIADFICKIFVNDRVAELWQDKKGFPENIFQQLLNQALPKLKEKAVKPRRADDPKDPEYHVINSQVIALFQRDFEFLSKDKQSFLTESDLLFKFYYFFYISQLAFTLNTFFDAGTGFTPLYFTIESETVSENRQTIKKGWKMLEPRLINLMSHSVNLDMLNRLPLPELPGGYDYAQLKELFSACDEEAAAELAGYIGELNAFYTSVVPVEKSTWDEFQADFDRKTKYRQFANDPEKKVVELFHRIEFQFDYSSRKSKRQSFANWFLFFCKENFLKNRGRNGYSLTLSHEMLIFLTKLCIGEQPKIRLNDLMRGFKDRGIYFDEASKRAILEIYEKINLIEKKSDSGDAQYIRQVL
jgi:DNA phosphorothioation-dependent restriction protein DptG